MKINFTLFAVLFLTISLFAQTDNVAESDTTKKKKRLNLSFRLDYGLNKQPAFVKTRYFYEGELFQSSPDGFDWVWAEQDRPAFQNSNGTTKEISKQTNIKFDLMLSLTEQMNIGLSYKLLSLDLFRFNPDFPTYSSLDFYVFFSICGTIDYEWQIPKVKNLYLNPTVSIGAFQDNYLDGRTGTNLYYDAKLALFYRLFDKLSIRAWASYDHFLYRNKRTSEIFPDRERVEKLDFQFINYGLGLSYRFFIYPD